jgi:hypothetical protein
MFVPRVSRRGASTARGCATESPNFMDVLSLRCAPFDARWRVNQRGYRAFLNLTPGFLDVAALTARLRQIVARFEPIGQN